MAGVLGELSTYENVTQVETVRLYEKYIGDLATSAEDKLIYVYNRNQDLLGRRTSRPAALRLLFRDLQKHIEVKIVT